MERYAARWIYMAILYFVMAVALGIFMGASRDHGLMPVHAHLNLLGWVSMALTGFIYQYFTDAGRSRLANVHFWVYNLTLPPMMIALSLLLKGHVGIEPVLGILSMVMGVSVLLFAVNLFFNGPRSVNIADDQTTPDRIPVPAAGSPA